MYAHVRKCYDNRTLIHIYIYALIKMLGLINFISL